jgi:hypothetical protein
LGGHVSGVRSQLSALSCQLSAMRVN